MRLFMVRHGESENNVSLCYTGWMQVSLTEKGFKDAESIRGFLAKIKYDKIYSSDLIRAKQTAETAIPGCTYEESSLIKEINVGELAGKKVSLCYEEYGEDYAKNKAANDFVSYGGENAEMLRNRVGKFFEMVAERGDETVIAFAHAGVIKSALKYVVKAEFAPGTLLCPNCTVAVFEHNGEKWRFGGWISPEFMA